MLKFKIISFNMRESIEEMPVAGALRERITSVAPGQVERLVRDLRLYGLPMAGTWIKDRLQNGRVEEIIQALVNRVNPPFVPEMITIPAGTFTMGDARWRDAKPVRQVTITRPFGIGKYPVTNREYRAYLEATGQEVPPLVADDSKARHPVVKVKWDEAVAYCEWLSEATGRRFRLPTEAEGEYAARGEEGRAYPWGNELDLSKVNFNSRGTIPVDAHPEGATPEEVEDMSGNVWEWREDYYRYEGYHEMTAEHGFSILGTVDPKGNRDEGSPYRVVRGGSWINEKTYRLHNAFRYLRRPWSSTSSIGFRVAEDL